MATPPKFRTVRADQTQGGDEMPDWAIAAFGAINQTFREICGALGKQLTRGDNLAGGSKTGLTFTSAASGAITAQVKCDMANPPKHFTVSKLELDDGSPPTSAWSIGWRNLSGTTVEVTFQGLSASTKYKFSCLYE